MTISSGDTSWVLISTGLVLLMVPALGFFEARKIEERTNTQIEKTARQTIETFLTS